MIRARFADFTAEQVLARLEATGIANARLNSVQEFWDHPQVQARDRWRTVESEVGPLQALLPPVTARDTEPQMGPIPALGAHTDSILAALGYTEETIAQLRTTEAI